MYKSRKALLDNVIILEVEKHFLLKKTQYTFLSTLATHDTSQSSIFDKAVVYNAYQSFIFLSMELVYPSL